MTHHVISDTFTAAPIGYTYDSLDNVLTYKDSDGWGYEYTRDLLGNELTLKNSSGVKYEYTRDDLGNVLTYKDSDGWGYERTYDPLGNELTYKHSDGWGYEYTRDPLGNELTYKRSDGSGLWVALAHDPEYVLYYNADTGIYWAGCRRLTRTDALAHWSAPKRTDARAVLFHAAITNHTP